MNLISIKSCIVLLIIVVSIVGDDIKWSDKPDVARLVKRIDQKLSSFRQVIISSREALNVNDNCEKMSWGSELSIYHEDGCGRIEITLQLYIIIFVGILLIILIFYCHIIYPENYLSEYKDYKLWQDVDCKVDPYNIV